MKTMLYPPYRWATETFITVNAVIRLWVTKAHLTSSDGKPYLLNMSVLSGEDQYNKYFFLPGGEYA